MDFAHCLTPVAAGDHRAASCASSVATRSRSSRICLWTVFSSERVGRSNCFRPRSITACCCARKRIAALPTCACSFAVRLAVRHLRKNFFAALHPQVVQLAIVIYCRLASPACARESCFRPWTSASVCTLIHTARNSCSSPDIRPAPPSTRARLPFARAPGPAPASERAGPRTVGSHPRRPSAAAQALCMALRVSSPNFRGDSPAEPCCANCANPADTTGRPPASASQVAHLATASAPFISLCSPRCVGGLIAGMPARRNCSRCCSIQAWIQ